MQELIGGILKKIRIKNNLNVEEVANKMAINYKTLMQYEKGVGLSIEKIEKLLKLYNFDIQIFFTIISVNMHSRKKLNS